MSDNVIQGRPDFGNRGFGVTRATRHPKYVYGNALGMLMHEISYVEYRWYEVGPGGHSLVRLNSPFVSITTRCQQVFYLRNRKGKARSTMCEIPKTDAVLCGRCQGKGPIFSKNSKGDPAKKEAKLKLGCNDVVSL